MIPVTTFAGRRVAVFGLGASGNATALALIAGGAQVAAWDDGAASRENAARAGVPLVDLAAADWSTFSTLVLAPGVPLTHPQPHWVVLKARQESAKREKACAVGIEVIGDIELFFRERAAVCPSAPVIAITGTNGKSTTTALIAHILKASGLDAQMGGNIGRAVLTLAPFFAPSAAHPQPARAPSAAHGPDAKWASEGPTKRPDAKWASEGPTVNRRIYVLELSSFQIDLTTDAFLEPTVGVLLNVTPDHLDRHGPADDAETAMRTYAAIKERLVSGAQATAIGIEDAFTRAALERLDERGADTYPFTTGKGAAIIPRLYAIGSTLFVHEQHRTHASSTELVSLDGVGAVVGRVLAVGSFPAFSGILPGSLRTNPSRRSPSSSPPRDRAGAPESVR